MTQNFRHITIHSIILSLLTLTSITFSLQIHCKVRDRYLDITKDGFECEIINDLKITARKVKISSVKIFEVDPGFDDANLSANKTFEDYFKEEFSDLNRNFTEVENLTEIENLNDKKSFNYEDQNFLEFLDEPFEDQSEKFVDSPEYERTEDDYEVFDEKSDKFSNFRSKFKNFGMKSRNTQGKMKNLRLNSQSLERSKNSIAKFDKIFESPTFHIESSSNFEEENSTDLFSHLDFPFTALIATNNSINFIPTGISTFFPNLTLFAIINSNLIEVRRHDFVEFQNLRALWLPYNKIKILEWHLFDYTPHLEQLILTENQIIHIHLNAFEGVRNLIHLDLIANECVNKFATTSEDVKELMENLSENCKVECDCEIYFVIAIGVGVILSAVGVFCVFKKE